VIDWQATDAVEKEAAEAARSHLEKKGVLEDKAAESHGFGSQEKARSWA
jgi:hypothetical protein